MIALTFGLVLAYVIGAIPTAYLFAKLLKGIDIRAVGSGNVGATNVYRAVGKIPGLIVLLMDISKGAIPVIVVPLIIGADLTLINQDTYKILLGACAIIGHVWTIFLKFKGGKGVATTAGVLLVITPKIMLVAFIIWLILLFLFRYVSVASIVSAFSLPITAIIIDKPISVIIFLSIIMLIGTYKHKGNISRLIKGEEHRIF